MRSMTLFPFAALYSAVTFFRNKAFDLGLLRTERVRIPVIAVGNLTAGGTGKTPIVEYLVALLLERRKRVAVLSRGYGRSTRGVVVVSDGKSVLVNAAQGGDEAVQVARKFPHAVVIVAERRVQGARHAVEKFGAEVLVLDDAYQHRSLHRDCNILVIDASKDLRLELPLPAGRRREPLSGMRRASVVVWAGNRGGAPLKALGQLIRPWFDGPMVRAVVDIEDVVHAGSGDRMDAAVLASKSVLAFSGIGNPGRFAETVAASGAEIAGWVTFPDHHRYDQGDIEGLLETFRNSHADLMLTTEKDAIRMMADEEVRENFLARFPVWYLPIVVRLTEGEETLHEMVVRLVPVTS
jgi:tetraacyldisaccharide 4'-kinase